MATGKALDGMPYAGNPHVRLGEGEFAPTATPRRGSLPYTKLIILSTMACAVAFPLVAAGSAALSADEKTLTISVDAGETWTYSDALPTTVTKIVKTGAGECSFAPSAISFTGTVQIDEGTLKFAQLSA